MNEWVQPAVLAAAVTGFFTYMATRRSTENIYTKEIRKMIDSYREEVVNLRKEISDMKKDLNAKDELIVELKAEKARLWKENGELKDDIKLLRGEE